MEQEVRQKSAKISNLQSNIAATAAPDGQRMRNTWLKISLTDNFTRIVPMRNGWQMSRNSTGYEGIEVHKIYFSIILNLCDRRIVAFMISERNDNPLIFKTFDKSVEANPDAHPLFHSVHGFQYTNRVFHTKLECAGMTQSMSRVAHCIATGPMEGFWGSLKRERYYGNHFTDRREPVQMIHIHYYNTRRVQRRLGLLTPIEKHQLATAA